MHAGTENIVDTPMPEGGDSWFTNHCRSFEKLYGLTRFPQALCFVAPFGRAPPYVRLFLSVPCIPMPEGRGFTARRDNAGVEPVV